MIKSLLFFEVLVFTKCYLFFHQFSLNTYFELIEIKLYNNFRAFCSWLRRCMVYQFLFTILLTLPYFGTNSKSYLFIWDHSPVM